MEKIRKEVREAKVTEKIVFHCGHCGAEFDEYDEPKYCSECGYKVIY